MNQPIVLTMLSENTAHDPQLLCEHGFSLHIKTPTNQILFDAGASTIFLENAEKRGIDPAKLDTVILSHGHYDHTGGLHYLKNKNVHCHPDIFIPKYKTIDKKEYIYIGNEYIRCFYENNNQLTFNLQRESKELFPEFWLVTDFKKEVKENYFYKKNNYQEYIADDFSDEVALAIKTTKGLVIITGCAHSGIINIIEKCLAVTGEKQIQLLLGGFHLSKENINKVKEVADKINKYNIENIGISHCTGEVLAQYLNCKNVFNFNTGDTVYA